MSKGVHTADSCIQEFLDDKFENAKPYTRDKCRWSLQRTRDYLEAAGRPSEPRRITPEDILFLMNGPWSDKTVSYQKSEYSYFKRYLKHFGNNCYRKANVQFAQDMRVNVDWLDEVQYQQLLDFPKTPLQEIIIHLELCMGLRSVECVRLTLNDVHDAGTRPYLNVRGKGRGNGKYRTISFHKDTRRVLDGWMVERDRMVREIRAYNPSWKDPGTLLIYKLYKNKPRGGAYTEHSGAIDELVLDPIRDSLGFHFANHTLRRTFGRRLYHAEVPIETISKMLGHESTIETLKYIGICLDDMDDAMLKFAQYDRKQRLTGGVV
ncbi:MAG: site-specific integrase [Candidatus Methanomethylophilaceae archaeon]|nr:site-specific integrase [Candidatus Methanomethylophilaceae archaeon]